MNTARRISSLVGVGAVLLLASCATRPRPAAAHREHAGTDATGFRRASDIRPLATAAIHYNDAAGLRAVIGPLRPQRIRPAVAGLAGRLLSVELRDPRGRLLPGVRVGRRWLVVGEKGDRYSIVVRNRSRARVEAVLSVDGLDALDGGAASFRKPGALIPPRGTVRMDGFRRNTGALFRFRSVSESYANQKDAGVIGIAFFSEAGANPMDKATRRRLRSNAATAP